MKTHLTRMLFIYISYLASIFIASCGSTSRKGKEVYARSTNYHNTEKIGKKTNGDKWTKNFKSSTGVSLRYFTDRNGIGAVAVDPNIFPYGTIIVAPDGRKYIAVDTGTAVISRKASVVLARRLRLDPNSKEARAPVLDFFGREQVGNYWDEFKVVPYDEDIPFIELPISKKLEVIRDVSRDS